MTLVADLDRCAEQLYTSPDPALRQQAYDQLTALTKEGDDGRLLLAALNESTSQYTLLFLAEAMVTWYKANYRWLNQTRQQEIIVAGCGECVKRITLAGAPRHVVLALLTCYARLVKLSYEKEPYVKEAVRFALDLQRQSVANDKLHFVALLLLGTLVAEFSRHNSTKTQTFMSFACHRRCSNNFRDESLLDIFTAALIELETASVATTPYLTELVELVKECLCYDFMAIRVDETEEALSAQFPSSWKETLLAERTRRVLWGQHAALPYPYCATLMTGLVSLCGIRRTFFDSTEERVEYLNTTLAPLIEVAQNMDGRLKLTQYLTVYAEACQRLVGPFGYRDLHQSSLFAPFLDVVRAITRDTFTIPFGEEGSATTVTGLLTFWQQLSTSRRMFSSAESTERDLEYVTPGLVIDFFQSRVRLRSGSMAVQPGLSTSGTTPTLNNNTSNLGAAAGGGVNGINSNNNNGGVMNLSISSTTPQPGTSPQGTPAMRALPGQATPTPFDSGDFALTEEKGDIADGSLEVMTAQSDAIAEMAVLEHTGIFQVLATYLNTDIGPAVLRSVPATAWLFFLAASLVRRVLPHLDEAGVDGCAAFLRFCVDCANHRRLAAGSRAAGDVTFYNALVERAVLLFLDNVQIILAGYKIEGALEKLVTDVFQSRGQLFQFVLSTMGHNLLREVRGDDDEESAELIRASLELIRESSRDISCALLGELTFELPPVVTLPLARSLRTYKLRTNLHAVMWPLMSKMAYSYEQLECFLQPIVACIESSVNSTNAAATGGPGGGGTGSSNNAMGEAEALSPMYVAGWMRDLRGVAQALHNNSEAFRDFVDWCSDAAEQFRIVLAGPAGESPMVVISFLRFYYDLVRARDWGSSHATECHSGRGLRLFKQLCSFIQLVLGRCIVEEKVRALSSGAVVDGVYQMLLKPLALSMQCLRGCFEGGFVPFGAMWYYNDDTYDATLLSLLHGVQLFPLPLFREYAKVPYVVMDLLRTVTGEGAYQPMMRLTTAEFDGLIQFAMSQCEDENVRTDTLLASMSFLAFIADFVHEVKSLSMANGEGNRAVNGGAEGGELGSVGRDFTAGSSINMNGCTPPRSPLQMPALYAPPGLGRMSGTPGSNGRRYGRHLGGALTEHSMRGVRLAIARVLEPIAGLWPRLLTSAMNVIVCQDRALEMSCSVVYPIMEVHPPFWYEFVDGFVKSYPERKQKTVQEALSKLSNSNETQDHFYSAVFAFRQSLRTL